MVGVKLLFLRGSLYSTGIARLLKFFLVFFLLLAKKRLILHVYLQSYVQKLSNALINLLQGPQKSFAGRMRPAGLTLAISVIVHWNRAGALLKGQI